MIKLSYAEKCIVKSTNALDIDQIYINNVENGRMNPTLSTLEKISNALGISSGELLK